MNFKKVKKREINISKEFLHKSINLIKKSKKVPRTQ